MTQENKMGREEQGFLLFLYTETPLHAGGEEGFGTVDLPIQRERITRLPVVQGSGVKGALRETLTPRNRDESTGWIEDVFGPEPKAPKDDKGKANTRVQANDGEETSGDQGENKNGDSETTSAPSTWAGAMSVLDARLLLFPVRSVRGGWAWTTAPIQLQRLKRDLEIIGVKTDWQVPTVKSGAALVGDNSTVVLKDSAQNQTVVLEDAFYKVTTDANVDNLAVWLQTALPEMSSYRDFRDRLPKQLVVLTDTDFTYLGELATEVCTRIRIDYETGTVAKGALWTEESLPSESLLWSLATMVNSRKTKSKEGEAKVLVGKVSEALKGHGRIRLGGDRTIGRGWMGVRLMDKMRQEKGDGSK